jgi:NAD(P)-dependent dehydrogenase (short-subunit alcohol dehydrogenase family)
LEYPSGKSRLLTTQVSIITGTSSGLGLTTAKLFLHLGAAVLGVDQVFPPSVLCNHSRFRFYHDDLGLAGRAQDIVLACQDAFCGRIDILLNIQTLSHTEHDGNTLEPRAWDQDIAQNLRAPALLSAATIKILQSQKTGGSIVNVFGQPQMGAVTYSTTSAVRSQGLVGLTKDIAMRFKASAIRCNAVCFDGIGNYPRDKTTESAWKTESAYRKKRASPADGERRRRCVAKIFGPDDCVPCF